MEIDLRLNVMDPTFIDPAHDSGLTVYGYETLVESLVSAGYEIVDGPTAVPSADEQAAAARRPKPEVQP